MKDFNEYIDTLAKSCQSTIEQMTMFKVNGVEQRQVLKEQDSLLFAHIISYTDCDKKNDGEFVLGFANDNDALKLASAISERLGIGKFEKVCEDSTDLLNEFLNIVVGRTISEWDSMGLTVKFGTPVFKKNYQGSASKNIKGYIIVMDITSDPEGKNSVDQLLMRVSFIEKVENKIENKKILLVDDSKVMRHIIAKILKKNGAKIKEANNGEEAIEIYKTFNPDLTLMDINMPKMDGFESIIHIRKFCPDSKFIILSSSSKKEEILNVKILKLSGYLIKPVDPDTLVERVSSVL